MKGDQTQLSSKLTVERYRQLEAAEDRQALAQFFCERFDERYFCPLTYSTKPHGFATMAVCCLAIETLESFYQGMGDTNGQAGRMFRDFFGTHGGSLSVFSSPDNWFYKDVRCGILHQGETRNGWRILRSGLLMDERTKTINASTFLKDLRGAVDAYSKRLLDVAEIQHWICFKTKMKTICDNCYIANPPC